MKMFIGDAVTISLLTISTLFVLRTSILKSKARFRGFQPQSEIACMFEGTYEKELAIARLQIGTMLVFVTVGAKPILVFNNTRAVLKFLTGIFQQTFFSAASPTCHRELTFGRPRHTI